MTEEQALDDRQDPEASITTAPEANAQERAAESAGAHPQMLSAVSPSRLAAPTPPEAVRGLSLEVWWMAAQKVAFDWQAMSVWADVWELAAPPSPAWTRA